MHGKTPLMLLHSINCDEVQFDETQALLLDVGADVLDRVRCVRERPFVDRDGMRPVGVGLAWQQVQYFDELF